MNLSKKLPIDLKNKLPITYKIIESRNLLIDNRVKAVFISGSRGSADSFTKDCYLDIGRIVDRESIQYKEREGDESTRGIKKG